VSAPQKPPRDLTFDLLRGTAVLYIVAYYHIQEVWLVQLPGSLAGWLARVALALFCFLSGYLLASQTTITDLASTGRFLKRRLLKIYPLYLLALLGFLGLGLIEPALFWRSAFLINTLINWNLLTLWFVSMIFLFYGLMPLFLWKPSVWKTCALTAGLLMLLSFLRISTQGIDPRLFPNLVAFAFGILLTQAPRVRTWFLQPSFGHKVGFLIVFGAVSFLTWKIAPQDEQPLHVAWILLWFGAALPWLIVLARKMASLLPAKGISSLATASFVLYLSHRIVFRIGENLLPAPTPLVRQFYYLLVLLPVALILSYWLQVAYQRLTSGDFFLRKS
jgi:peptidoglycan/LPS O-acetylase OafA/YrhL